MAANIHVAECEYGRGIFAARGIRLGETILTFRGRRYDRDDPIHATADASLLLQTGTRTYILPEAPSVYVNHSCAPNAGLVANRRLVALVDILPGEHIAFDYSTSMDDGMWTLDCRCGHSECRGLVEDFRHLPAPLRRRYLEQGIVQGFIARRYRPRSEAGDDAAQRAIA
ncbi:SET domain-containing protein [bacterium]|nr:SET domain-containing protein [bacterium]